ncbi:MAG: hypothetical protein II951_01455 [Bacteroidales bacterium]|nr:hypothetical protein [Bacteroidales bacterium]
MNGHHIKALIVSIIGIWSAAIVEIKGQNPIVETTSSVMMAGDYNELSFRIPAWQNVVEKLLTARDTLPYFQSLELSDYKLYYHVWESKNRRMLLWAVSAKTGENGLMPTSLAFSDNLAMMKSRGAQKVIVRPSYNDGLCGFEVADSVSGNVMLYVPDVECRISLNVLGSIEYPDSVKMEAERVMNDRMGKAPNVLSGDLSGMQGFSVCRDEETDVTVITYMDSHKDFTSHCGGWIVSRPKKNRLAIARLQDCTERIGKPEQSTLSNKAWYGALYTKIVPFKKGRKQYYLLSGFKSVDPQVKTRVLDVMQVNGSNVTFGYAVFKHPKSTYKRRVFKYSARASMNVFVDEQSGMIVFDHLEPSDPLLTGQYSYYGPDLSYDAYLYDDGVWKFQTDIQITREKGAEPNKEVGRTQSDMITSNGQKRTNGYKGGATGKGFNSRGAEGQSRSSSWFDKGKGNSAPNIRKR